MIIFNKLACVAGVLAPFDGLLGKKFLNYNAWHANYLII
jgi:hypothetical protein